MVRDNWAIVEPRIADLRPGQRGLCREIFRGLCSEDGLGRFERQIDEDHGGFDRCHVALFGEPGTDRPFEWVLTGRHGTLRADGNRGGASFGGPVFYGHAATVGNVWAYQVAQANAILRTLGPDPLGRALAVGGLDGQQQPMVRALVEGLLRPFRGPEVEQVRAGLDDPGGLDALRLTFYRGEGADRGDHAIWKLEGPAFSWHFHGSPHVHAWLNLARRA